MHPRMEKTTSLDDRSGVCSSVGLRWLSTGCSVSTFFPGIALKDVVVGFMGGAFFVSGTAIL